MSNASERALFIAFVDEWHRWVDDEGGDLQALIAAIRALGVAMGLEWREFEG